MDMTDLLILKELRQDSRESMSNISERMGISKATVSRRLARLERDGIIDGYSLSIDLNSLGIIQAILCVEVTGSSVNAVIEDLRRFSEIKSVHKAFGDHSLICTICSKSVDGLYSLIQDKVINVPNIHNVQVDILVEMIDLNKNADLDLIQLRR